MRVVSLVPSLSETLDSWGLRPVAVTRFCDLAGVTRVGGTKDPDVAAIVALAPDLVVVDEEENRREDYEALVAQGLYVHATAVRGLEDVDRELRALAGVLGHAWVPPRWPPRHALAHRVVVPIWRRPWIALGAPTYATSLLAHLGYENVLADAGPYPHLELAEMARARPELVLAPSEPYPFAERHRAELETVAPMRFVDGRDLFWWGERTPAAMTRLAHALDSSS
ncbi:MAG: helical backbone metal receptor [Acidimicrobiales bacterium]